MPSSLPATTTAGAELGGVLEDLLRWARRLPAPGDVSVPALGLLARLAVEGSAGISELAARERVSQPATSQMVDRLERSGLVERSPSPTDRRAVVVALTDAGAALLAQRRASRAAALDHLVEAAPPGDVDAIRHALPALVRLVAAAAQAPPRTPTAGETA